ncbi:9816_t:CDS:2 [Dentiscutata heterogama]|uniref:9816_t:CDS:1 n=1 Tax=Dentiscutata heterogama TaxID=1316150 RepID=A0ACA9KF14_9GLOM|nr:9816_t:CDS:2 [Dentiscutata heterogama]
MIPGTSQEYANIYMDCWYSELEKRPKLVRILNDLDNLSTETICKEAINQILVTTIFSDAKQNVSKIEFDKESLMNKPEEVKSNNPIFENTTPISSAQAVFKTSNIFTSEAKDKRLLRLLIHLFYSENKKFRDLG